MSLAAATTLVFAATAALAGPASAGTTVIQFRHATWSGTIQVDNWMDVGRPCPEHVTMEGTLTAPYLGRATFSMTVAICGSDESDSFLLSTTAGTITGDPFWTGPMDDGLYYAAMCNYGSGTGRYANLIFPAENCALGGTIIAISITGLEAGNTDPIPTSGPAFGNVTF